MTEQTSPEGPCRSDDSDWYSRYGIRHIAIIPDGNRRWATQQSVPIEVGHSNGLLQVLPDLVEQLCDAGVHTITVWGFSTENWSRDAFEVTHLMKIITEFLRERIMDMARRHDARVCHLGRKDRLFPEVLEALEFVEAATAHRRSHVYNIALDYGGQDELLRATERMANLIREQPHTNPSVLDFLDTAGQPHPQPDVVIRSSGEQRMSGFLPLQTAYSELFFVDEFFPEFTFKLMQDVAEQFKWRKRRYGS
ncbi:MAG: polyprenyl diphosphate synthase [Polyangiales bacterium]